MRLAEENGKILGLEHEAEVPRWHNGYQTTKNKTTKAIKKTTVNPIMGCDGCELWKPAAAIATTMLATLLLLTKKSKGFIKPAVDRAVGDRDTSALYRDRERVAVELAVGLSLTREQQKEMVDVVRQECKCYAGLLGTFRGGHKGYAEQFERPAFFPGRMAKAARWNLPSEREMATKPWLEGCPRLIFVSDMGDALSKNVSFDYLLQEIIANVSSDVGSRHFWLWLSKRPAQMAKFGDWLTKRGVAWPDNLMAMTTVTAQSKSSRVDELRKVPSRLKGLSLEPLFEPVDLDFEGIDWLICGGGSDVLAQPFHVEWALHLLDQCRAAGVAFFLKQLGKKPFYQNEPLELEHKHGGDWSEWREAWQVREVPEAFRASTLCGSRRRV
jgi:protein gp37